MLRQVEFPQTHNIGVIINLIKTVNGELATELVPAAALAPYGAGVRYPGDIPESTAKSLEVAIEMYRKRVEGVYPRRAKSVFRRTPRNLKPDQLDAIFS